jgi:hypothetical protein
MRATNRLRVLVVGAGVAASVLAFGAMPALAAASVETGTATWHKIYGLQEGISPMTCSVQQRETTADWTCDTPSAPLVANGADCTENTYVDVAGVSIKALLPGCSASLSIPSSGWPGKAACATTSSGTTCTGEMADGFGTFTFQPAVGSPLLPQPAIISDAACTSTGGHATVTSAGVAGTSGSFSMTGTITWTGSCSDSTSGLLIWQGQVNIL